MAFNFFQKNKNNRPDSSRVSKEKISEKSSGIFGSKKDDVALPQKAGGAPQGMIPHISEKSSNLSAKNFYVFKMKKNVNKIMLKKMVENHYGVKVETAKILNTKPKKRIRGNIVGKKPGYKKAIVQLKEGHKIEF